MSFIREYMERSLGTRSTSFLRLICVELYNILALNLPGSLGIASRMAFARMILLNVGKWPIILHGVTFRGVRKISLADDVKIESFSMIDASALSDGIFIGDKVEIHRGVAIHTGSGNDALVRVGSLSKIGPNVSIYGNGGVEIGTSVLIAANTVITSSTHNTDRVDLTISEQGLSVKPIVIESDVWIGANCVIMPGIRIGHGSVIGSNSFVNSDIPAQSIAFGQPAKAHRSR